MGMWLVHISHMVCMSIPRTNEAQYSFNHCVVFCTGSNAFTSILGYSFKKRLVSYLKGFMEWRSPFCFNKKFEVEQSAKMAERIAPIGTC